MDYAVLRAELADARYAGLNDQQAADVLNARVIQARKFVPVVDITTYLRSQGAWLGIKAAAPTNAAAAAAVDYNDDPRTETLNLDLPIVVQMLAALAQAGILTETHVADLNAMADYTMSRAQQLGLGTVSAGDIQTARAY